MWFQENKNIFISLLTLLFITILCAIGFGAVSILPKEMYSSLLHFFKGEESASIYESVFLKIRLPRVLLCAITGAVLSVSGVLMQGLFRNPIVEPGLTGTSSGAAFGASIVFVLSAGTSPEIKAMMGTWLVPLFAFLGGLLATFIVYFLAKESTSVPVLSLLLIGMAINAIGLSGTGFMSYIARDPQARSITFWNLGTFSGSSWSQVLILSVITFFVLSMSFRYAKNINALLLGEEEAGYLGIDIQKLKRNVLILNTLMVSVATAFVGVISFIGLIIPHILRNLIGSDNKKLIPASILTGAIILLLADLAARLILAPAEIPIGILTSLVGAPIFIILLRRNGFFRSKIKNDA